MIDIIGAGAWGTALAFCLAEKKSPIKLFTKTKDQAKEINYLKKNQKYFPDHQIPNEISISALAEVNADSIAEIAFVCIPTTFLQELFSKYFMVLQNYKSIIIASKGIEIESGFLPHQIAFQYFKNEKPDIAIISGPSFAEELIKKKPAALTFASKELSVAQKLAKIISRKHLRIYPSSDLNGVATLGALKNVLALASGISDGMELGENARAALITRGINEISRFILSNGGNLESIYGLAGVGDIILSCVSSKSRNYRAGVALAKGESIDKIIKKIGTVEGINTTLAIKKIIDQQNLSAPICMSIWQIIKNRISAREAVDMLMNRPIKNQEK